MILLIIINNTKIYKNNYKKKNLKADHQSACSNAWKANTRYNKGDKASNAGILWEAQFISYGQPPSNWLWKEIGSSSC